MTFDTLQRWHEQNHLDTSAYRITPFRRIPVPRYSPLPAIALALDKILPEVDPVKIAQRRLAIASLPTQERRLALQDAQTQLQMQYGLPMMKARYEALRRAYNIPGAINPLTGQPVTKAEQLQQQKLDRAKENINSFMQWRDAAGAYDNNAHPAHQPDQSSIDTSQTPLPGLGGLPIPEVTVGEPEDTA